MGKTQGRGLFRCAGDAHLAFGFQLTGNDSGSKNQQGHLACLSTFAPAGSKIEIKFEYNMFAEQSTSTDGEGLCAYLLDPSVQGWDTDFNGTGPMGFVDKTGALLGICFDNTGNSSDGTGDHVSVCSGTGTLIKKTYVSGGFLTSEDDWQQVKIKLDITAQTCSVELGGKQICESVSLKVTDVEDIEFPKELCVGVCGAAHNRKFMIAVNDVKL